MKNSPITILSTDWHLKDSNIDQIKDLISQKIKLATELNISIVFCLGDIFDSRKAQSEAVLNAFGDVLDMFEQANIILVAIAGNHDRTNNKESNSFITPFKTHSSLHLTEITGGVRTKDVMFHLLPYFDKEVYESLLSQIEIEPTCKNVLLTHQALNGATNNDGSKVENDLTPDKFKKFDKVFCGHYHNRKDEYIGSLYQANYGEDDQKGFTVVYSDLSTKLIKAKFKEYHKIVVKTDLFTKEKLNKLVQQHENSEHNVRFEFVGNDVNVTAIDIDLIKSKGIDVKIKRQEVERSIEQAEHGELIEFDNQSIVKEFKAFCEQEKVEDIEFGLKLLTETLK